MSESSAEPIAQVEAALTIDDRFLEVTGTPRALVRDCIRRALLCHDGNVAETIAWMESPNRSLDDVSPSSLIHRGAAQLLLRTLHAQEEIYG
ncbi:MAG: hypothetical protein Greene041619_679 [Candidatus Peregrinibacteria bacterium Greene0416_19]|nr:MAG: hypothetical protein Greene041619_679 [Candidatus Peregrinibacteria bacterium Greene0416_19]